MILCLKASLKLGMQLSDRTLASLAPVRLISSAEKAKKKKVKTSHSDTFG